MDNPSAAHILRRMERDADVIIVGGGLNGTCLAVALAQGGLTVTLVDRLTAQTRADPAFDGRSYAIARGSQRMLAAIGLWPSLAPDAQPIMEIKVTDGRAGEGASPLMLAFDQAEIEDGPMGFMVEDRHLRPALLQAVADTSGISHIPGMRVVEQTTGAVTLDDGQIMRASVIVGADGIGGQTAARAGIRKMAWNYNQTAVVCAVETEHPHNGVAHQFFMPPGPLAILPLKGNRVSIVWSETAETAAAFAALDDDAFLEILRPRFGGFLGELKLAGIRYTYPLSLSLAERFATDRVALVGDAAHRVHPIAGQGLNAGLRDVATLAEVLVDAHRRGEDIGAADVLGRYQQWRRFDTAALAFATDGFNRLFSNDNPLLRAGRDLGMSLVNRIPGLRRGLIREAAGLTGDLPRLSRGLPL